MARAVLTDSAQDLIIKMSDGNPGAITVLTKLLFIPSGIGPLLALWLDEWKIYGSSIWILYKDWCSENLDTMVEAIQNGSAKALKENGQLEG
jgi:hypothetical protein